MNRNRWIGFMAARYFKAARRDGRLASSVFSSAGIAIGAATLVVVLGVMNGFQSGFIDSILSIDSHHARVSFPSDDPARLDAFAKRAAALPGVQAALPFREDNTVVFSTGRRMLPLKVKSVPADAETRDPDFASRLGLRSGAFPVARGEILIGSELARSLGATPGEELSLLTVSSSEEDGVSARTRKLVVSGVFRSEYYDFDSGLGVVTIETAEDLFGPGGAIVGVKFGDRETRVPALETLAAEAGGELTSWRSYNRSFFGALRTEKAAMLLLVGLIFVVVGLNIYHAMKRNVFERMEEIAVLKAIGVPAEDVRAVFVADGTIIGLAGSAAGVAAGLLLASFVNEIVGFFERASLFLASLFGGGEGGHLAIYAQSPFYLFDIPVRVYFPEALLIFLAGTLSAVAAAYIASSRVPRYRPAEVLRNE